MKHQVTWPKDMREQAQAEGKALLAVGYDGPAGRNEFYGPCDNVTAQVVFLLGIKLHTGTDLDTAFAEIKASLAKLEANKSASEDQSP